jgi:hypothetical protein
MDNIKGTLRPLFYCLQIFDVSGMLATIRCGIKYHNNNILTHASNAESMINITVVV